MKVTRKTFDEVMIPCYNPLPMVLEKGNGCYLYDTDGNKYLDMTAGIAVNCLGHNHKGVTKVIKKQCCKLIHASNIFVNDQTLTLAKKLTAISGFDRAFFTNSGAEANEAALKLARRVAYDNYGEDKDQIISFYHSFHGRTLFSVSVGGQEKYSKGFGPIPGGITHIQYNDIDTFTSTISDKTCAVILETVQGEGGIIEGHIDFIKKVRELCDKYHAVLIFDEVQTGVGRTGSFYSFEQVGVRPDIVSTAKGLAAGLPIGAILTSDELAKHFTPGTHGTTFGGNALACSVGSYVVDTVGDEKFLQSVREKGELIHKLLTKLGKKYGVFDEIRGKGLMVGAHLSNEYLGKSGAVQKLCAKYGLFVLVANPDVVRFTPPLIISNRQIHQGMKMLEKALAEFVKTESKSK